MSNPSFLCVPYRYKASTLYSQVPSSALGDFNVVRSASNSATRVNAAGFIETVPDNVPRLDYPLGGITAGCPALLVEPTAQNLCPRSQEINLWTPNVATATPNAAISPDGTQNAELFIPDVNQIGRVEINVGGLTVPTIYTLTCFMKQHTASLDQITLYVSDGGSGTGGNRWGVNVNITGGFTLSNYNVGSVSVTSTSIENYGNGWYRIRVTGQFTSGGASCVAVIRYLGSTTNNGTNGVLVWGAQLEASSVPTSYIPTAASAVTRGEDRITKTGITSLIGQTEGTFYFEGEANFAATDLPSLNRSITNSILLAKNASNQVVAYVYYGGVFLPIFATASAITGPFKAALAYKQGSPGDTAFFVNGVQAGSTNAATWAFTGGLNDVIVRADPYIAGGKPYKVRALGVYPTRIPNTAPSGVLSLQSLTQ